MTTNFFENIAGLNIPGVWKIVIQTDENGNFTVSQLFTALQCGDNAASAIAPMNLAGTASELDENFFELITAPVQQVAGLYTTMEAHLKTVEEARLKSKMEQDAKAKELKAKTAVAGKNPDDIEVPKMSREERRKIYDEAMKKIGELSAGMKYADALALLPSVTDYPEKKTELDKKAEDLNRLKTQYDNQLFKLNEEENQS